ncbi:hypothetical protein ANAPC5_01359 [Anaplasma phagocytophilum]|nr:hypothetical protein ANAPC5_01359 [Anaplasma phagocytophilum]
MVCVCLGGSFITVVSRLVQRRVSCTMHINRNDSNKRLGSSARYGVMSQGCLGLAVIALFFGCCAGATCADM